MKSIRISIVILVSALLATIGFLAWPKPRASNDIWLEAREKSNVLSYIRSDSRYSRLEISLLGFSQGRLWYRISTTSTSQAAAERELAKMTESLVRWGRELPYLRAKGDPRIGMLDLAGIIGYSEALHYEPDWLATMKRYFNKVFP